MGYTMHQIQCHYNDIVANYKEMMFSEAPCSSVTNYSCNGIYRYTDLKSTVKDNLSIRVKLVSRHETLADINYPANIIDLDADQFINGNKNSTAHYNRFYYIDSNYYTSDIDEVRSVAKIRLKRYMDYWDHRSKTMYLDINKMSDSLITYLRAAVDSNLTGRTKVYDIKDVYFSYTGDVRKFVVVIKHEDKSATESFWFNPCVKHD